MALNCVANGKILSDGSFRDLWIRPAPGDASSAIGAALFAYHRHAKQPRTPVSGDSIEGGYLGPAYSQEEIVTALEAAKARYTQIEDEAELLAETVTALEADHAVGWLQGRMEFGPRALGARSIMGDPRNPQMQAQLNIKIKYRESFRPFVPSLLAEGAACYFDLDRERPYMLLVAPVRRTPPRPGFSRSRPEGHSAAGSATLRHSCHHARRLFGMGADSWVAERAALLCAASRLS